MFYHEHHGSIGGNQKGQRGPSWLHCPITGPKVLNFLRGGKREARAILSPQRFCGFHDGGKKGEGGSLPSNVHIACPEKREQIPARTGGQRSTELDRKNAPRKRKTDDYLRSSKDKEGGKKNDGPGTESRKEGQFPRERLARPIIGDKINWERRRVDRTLRKARAGAKGRGRCVPKRTLRSKGI